MASPRITERLREPAQPHNHTATCHEKDYFASAEDAQRGWLHRVYKCPICGGYHRTTKGS